MSNGLIRLSTKRNIYSTIFKTIQDSTTGKTKIASSGLFNGIFKGDFFKAQPIVSESDIAALENYNKLLADNKPQEAFEQAMNKASVTAQNLAKNAKGAAVDINAIPKASKAAAAGMKALSIAGNMLVSMGIAFAITKIIEGIQWLATSSERAKEAASELADELNTQKTTIEGNISTVSGLEEEFKRLSKGVDDYGANISLSADEYTRYQQIVQQIVGISPSLISGYDKEGNAIANKNGLIEQSIALLKKENRQRIENATSEETVKTLGKGEVEKYKDKEQEVQNKRRENSFWVSGNWAQAENKNEKLLELIGINDKKPWWLNDSSFYSDKLRDNYDVLFQNFDKIIAYNDELKKMGQPTLLSDDEIKRLQNWAKVYGETEAELERASKTLNPTLQMVPQSLTVYDELTDKQKAFVSEYINTFRITADTTKADIEKMRQDILDFTEAIGNASPETKKAIEDLFSLDKTKIPAAEWEKQVNDLINQIVNSLTFDSDEDKNNFVKNLKIRLGIEFTTDGETTVDTLISNVTEKFKGKFKEEIGQLSIDDLKILSNLDISPEGIESWAEVETLIANANKAANEMAVSLDAFNKSVDGMQSAYSTLTNARDEYNKNGAYSLDTLQALLALEPQYLAMLVNKNGQLVINEESMRKLVEAQLEETKAEIFATGISKLNALASEESGEASEESGDKKFDAADDINEESDALKKNTVEHLKNAAAQAKDKGASDEDIKAIVDETMDAVNAIESAVNGLDIDFSGTVGGFEEAKEQTTKLAEEIDKLHSSIDNIQSAYGALQGALEEQQEYGAISVDTLQSLLQLEPQYINMLIDENGNLTLNEAAINNCTAAYLDNLGAKTALNLIDSVSSLQTEKEQLELLTGSAYEAGQSLWDLVYAQLAAVSATSGASVASALAAQVEAIKNMTESAKAGLARGGINNFQSSADYERAAEAESNYAEKVADIRENLTEKEAQFAEDMAEAWKKEHLEQLKDGLAEQKDIIDKYKENLEVTEFGLNIIEPDNFAGKSDLLTKKLDQLTDYGTAMRQEFERVASIIPQTGDEAQELASRLQELGSDMRSNISDIRETKVEIMKLRVDAFSSLAETHMGELERELDNLTRRIEILNGDDKEDYVYTNKILSMQSLIPTYSDFSAQRREKARQDQELIDLEQETQDTINKIVSNALAQQAADNAAAREKERQELIKSITKARQDAAKQLAEAQRDLAKARTGAARILAGAHQDYENFLGDNEIDTGKSIQNIEDKFSQAKLKLPAIDTTALEKSVQDAVTRITQKPINVTVNAVDGNYYTGGGGGGGGGASGGGIPTGAAVYFSCNDPRGHVGIYGGDGLIYHAGEINGVVKAESLSEMEARGFKYRGWGWNGGVALTPEQQKAVAARAKKKGDNPRKDHCQAWVADVYANATGLRRDSRDTATIAGNDWIVNTTHPSLAQSIKTGAKPQTSSKVDVSHLNLSEKVTRWAPIAKQALDITGQYSDENLGLLLYQMFTESSGNQYALNDWDSNAAKGTPSKGLMQVIDPTFKKYALKGYDKDIYDPLSNMIASIRYTIAVYGSLQKGWKGTGYATGTSFHPGGLALVGDENWLKGSNTPAPEMAIYPDGTSEVLGKNGAEIRDLPKGTQVLPFDDTKKVLDKIPSYSKGTDYTYGKDTAWLSLVGYERGFGIDMILNWLLDWQRAAENADENGEYKWLQYSWNPDNKYKGVDIQVDTLEQLQSIYDLISTFKDETIATAGGIERVIPGIADTLGFYVSDKLIDQEVRKAFYGYLFSMLSRDQEQIDDMTAYLEEWSQEGNPDNGYGWEYIINLANGERISIDSRDVLKDVLDHLINIHNVVTDSIDYQLEAKELYKDIPEKTTYQIAKETAEALGNKTGPGWTHTPMPSDWANTATTQYDNFMTQLEEDLGEGYNYYNAQELTKYKRGSYTYNKMINHIRDGSVFREQWAREEDIIPEDERLMSVTTDGHMNKGLLTKEQLMSMQSIHPEMRFDTDLFLSYLGAEANANSIAIDNVLSKAGILEKYESFSGWLDLMGDYFSEDLTFSYFYDDLPFWMREVLERGKIAEDALIALNDEKHRLATYPKTVQEQIEDEERGHTILDELQWAYDDAAEFANEAAEKVGELISIETPTIEQIVAAAVETQRAVDVTNAVGYGGVYQTIVKNVSPKSMAFTREQIDKGYYLNSLETDDEIAHRLRYAMGLNGEVLYGLDSTGHLIEGYEGRIGLAEDNNWITKDGHIIHRGFMTTSIMHPDNPEETYAVYDNKEAEEKLAEIISPELLSDIVYSTPSYHTSPDPTKPVETTTPTTTSTNTSTTTGTSSTEEPKDPEIVKLEEIFARFENGFNKLSLESRLEQERINKEVLEEDQPIELFKLGKTLHEDVAAIGFSVYEELAAGLNEYYRKTQSGELVYSQKVVDAYLEAMGDIQSRVESVESSKANLRDAAFQPFQNALDDIDKYIEDRNLYGDWDAYGDNEVKAIQRQTKIIEEAYRNGILSYKEYIEKLEEQSKRIYSLGKNQVDKHLSNIDKYIEARNHYNDWDDFNDSEIDAIKRQCAVLDEAYKLNLISLEEYTEKSAQYTQKLYSVAKNNIIETISELVKDYEEKKQLESSQYSSLKTLLQSYYDVTNAVTEARHEIDKELKASKTMYEYLNEETRKLLFNQKDYNALSKELSEIQSAADKLQKQYQQDILNANAETIAEITSQYQMQYETMMKQYEIAKAELEVAKKRQKLDNVLAERNTRMFINGQWQWVAKTQDVINAQNELAEAEINREKQKASSEQLESINKFTKQINSIETDLNEVRITWTRMQEMLNGEVGDVTKVLKMISEVSSPELRRIIEGTGGNVEGFSTSLSESTSTLSTIISSDLSTMSTNIGSIIIDLQNYAAAIQGLTSKITGANVVKNNDSQKSTSQIIAEMKANSAAWHTASESDKTYLENRNQYLGGLIGAKYNSATGVWTYPTDANGYPIPPKYQLPSSSATVTNSTATKSDGTSVNITISNGNTLTKGLPAGTIVHTSGGDYKIVSAGTNGAKYNENSGYWSVKIDEKNADGTRYTSGGITLMGEEGFEAFIGNNGRLIPITQPTIGNIGAGGIVFNREQMANLRNLWDLSNLGKISPFVSSSNTNNQSIVTDNSIHINGLTVGEQGNEGWINGLRRYVATHK